MITEEAIYPDGRVVFDVLTARFADGDGRVTIIMDGHEVHEMYFDLLNYDSATEGVMWVYEHIEQYESKEEIYAALMGQDRGEE